jgi:hypothetical protein
MSLPSRAFHFGTGNEGVGQMRKILVGAAIVVLLLFFFHINRVEKVKSIHQSSLESLEKNNLAAALEYQEDYEPLYGHRTLQESIDENIEKFHLKLAKDAIAMAKEKDYTQPDGYNTCSALDVITKYEPQGEDWRPQLVDQMAEIAISQEMYFLTVDSYEELDEGREIFRMLKMNELLDPNLREEISRISTQLGFRGEYERGNWEEKIKMEMRDGKPYYFRG